MGDFACPGTRRSHDWNAQPREKWLATFTVNGLLAWGCRVDVALPDEKVWWYSYDKRVHLGSAEPTAGWGNAAWEDSWKCWNEKTDREVRASRALRMRENFRYWTNKPGEARYCIVLHNLPRTLGRSFKR